MNNKFRLLVGCLLLSITTVNAMENNETDAIGVTDKNNVEKVINNDSTSDINQNSELYKSIFQQQIRVYESKLEALQSTNLALQKDLNVLKNNLKSLSKEYQDFKVQEKKRVSELNNKLDLDSKNLNAKIEEGLNQQSVALNNIIAENEISKSQTKEKFSKVDLNIENIINKISALNSSTNNIKNSVNRVDKKTEGAIENINNNSLIGVLLVIIIILFVIIIFIMLNKKILKGQNSINDLQIQSEKINAEIVDKLSKDAETLTNILSSINTKQNQTSNDTDHSFVLSLSDRIGFMQTTLYRMDPKIRGHKQLSKTIEQMKENLLAKGYEIVDMLGKPYNEGMKVIASFMEDESLAEGTQIITGITKPQVNFNGVMIQSAQILVSQNK